MAVGSASVHEEPRSLDEPLNRTAVAEEAWNKYNLLSLGRVPFLSKYLLHKFS